MAAESLDLLIPGGPRIYPRRRLSLGSLGAMFAAPRELSLSRYAGPIFWVGERLLTGGKSKLVSARKFSRAQCWPVANLGNP